MEEIDHDEGIKRYFWRGRLEDGRSFLQELRTGRGGGASALLGLGEGSVRESGGIPQEMSVTDP